jgi:hypothetical protein
MVNKSKVVHVKPNSHKIHGLYTNKYASNYCCIVAIETIDNQIDFNYLIRVKNSEGVMTGYQLTQFRQLFPRNLSFDPVQKFVNIY